MRKLLIATIFCTALAGCNREPAATDQATTPPEAPGAPAAAAGRVSVESALPGSSITIEGRGVSFPFEHVVRYDRIGETKSKRQQRQMFFEVKGADVPTVVTQLTEAMAAAGYKAGEAKEEKGGQRLSFRRKDALPVSALVRPKADKPKLQDPAATASLYLTVTEKKPAS